MSEEAENKETGANASPLKSPQKSEKGMTLRQQKFIAGYVNPDSPTFGDGSHSYQAAYPNASPNTAKVKACNLLKRPDILTVVQEAFERQGFDEDLAARTLKEQVTGEARREQKRYKVDDEGNPSLCEIVELSPSFKDQQNAIHLKAKLDGHYQKLDITARAVDRIAENEFSQFKAQIKRDMKE